MGHKLQVFGLKASLGAPSIWCQPWKSFPETPAVRVPVRLRNRSSLPAKVPTPYLEGKGDLVSRLTMGLFRVVIWLIGFKNVPTKSP